MTPKSTDGMRIFRYKTSSGPASKLGDLTPRIRDINYTSGQDPALVGYCNNSSSATGSGQHRCMEASVRTTPLDFTIRDLDSSSTVFLRTVDKEWRFGDDAPSFVLRNLVEPRLVLQTAVTKRNFCDTLKVCLNDREPGPAVLAALTVALDAQDTFATYCTMPRLYAT